MEKSKRFVLGSFSYHFGNPLYAICSWKISPGTTTWCRWANHIGGMKKYNHGILSLALEPRIWGLRLCSSTKRGPKALEFYNGFCPFPSVTLQSISPRLPWLQRQSVYAVVLLSFTFSIRGSCPWNRASMIWESFRILSGRSNQWNLYRHKKSPVWSEPIQGISVLSLFPNCRRRILTVITW